MATDVEKIGRANPTVIDDPVVTKEKLALDQVDGALAFLRNEADASIAELDEKKLLRRIDRLIMPMLFGVYVLQYIDKSLINYANVMGLSKDTHMSPADFSYLATFFYVTFAVFQPVHAYLMQKFPTAKYLAVNVVLWGVTLAVHSACHNFGGLIVVRLLLGVFEASSAPCLILITGMWYKRAEQPLRVAIWYLGVGGGTIVGALASFGFQFYHADTFKSWQIMFLVFGIITVAWGIVVFLVLPDSPMASHFTHEEKVLAIERLRENMTGIENKTFKKPQFIETVMDPRTLLIAVIIIAGNVPTGACGTYSSTLIKGFGYTSKESALLNIPSGAISMIAVLSASWYAGRFNNRGYGIVALLLPGVLGGGLMAFLPKSDKAGKLAGIYLTQIFGPNLSMMYSWAAANYAGHTKKITINAIILFAYGASNIIGPLTFTGYTAPEYIPAKVAIMACLSLAIVTALILRFWYAWENKRRDRLAAAEGYVHVPDTEFMDLTDRQNLEFRRPPKLTIPKANPEYLALNWDSSGGGAFAVIPTNEKGRLPERIPLFRGHTAVVLDTDWWVFLWRVPDDFTLHLDIPADEVQDIAPVGKLSGHPKKVGHVLFNPAAENVLASAAGDFTVKIWDIESGSSKLSLKVGEVIQSLSWSANGSLLVTTSRDKKLRIWDTRQEKPVHEGPGHAGAKNSRAVWMGEHDRIATTGFSRMSDRQLALWDVRNAQEPIDGFQMLDSISGVCMPFWDEGTQCLFLAGRGDGNIRYYEYEHDKFEYLSEYKSSDPQRGVAFIPKRGVNLHENEVARAYKTVNDNYIEPISFIVPRRAETFQEDIYPPTVGLKPAMSSKEWLDGAEGLPPKISMESLYEGTGIKEVASDEAKPAKKAPEPVKAAEPKKAAPEPTPEPVPTTIRSPPPSMKEQGATMMGAADKFKDTEPTEGGDDESDFEEVQKPVERTTATKPVISEEKKAQSPTPAASKVWEDVEDLEPAPKHKMTETEMPDEQTVEAGEASNVAEASPASDSIEREIKNMKALIAQQSRQLSSLTKTVTELVAEVKALKGS
ncbi:hypothetical protein AYO21_06167 [Fonsecaea monophora]|uniref:Coronin n=1 Tax=Fonsecaea monophora TaxID=254056 RepID=A0A177F5L6_9EURO|nr:hypothetical protein AYO21_06167 [Fonsecaea monophora]OAG39523.1 hypothetical protein AYO21_06167 [Fonsecaea monophora]